jgi:uncharacterized membrane protein YesL
MNEMKFWNGKSAEWFRHIANYMILTGFWVLGCMLVVTIGPSTGAALAVIREWQLNKNDSVIRSFFRLFRVHFKQGFWVGNGWILAGVILSADLYVVLHLEFSWKVIFISLIGTACLLWLLVGTALFPCLIHYRKTGWSLVKASFVLTFSDIQTSIGILLFWFAGLLLFWYSPVLMLVCTVLIFYVTFHFSIRSFEKLEKRGQLTFLQS